MDVITYLCWDLSQLIHMITRGPRSAGGFPPRASDDDRGPLWEQEPEDPF